MTFCHAKESQLVLHCFPRRTLFSLVWFFLESAEVQTYFRFHFVSEDLSLTMLLVFYRHEQVGLIYLELRDLAAVVATFSWIRSPCFWAFAKQQATLHHLSGHFHQQYCRVTTSCLSSLLLFSCWLHFETRSILCLHSEVTSLSPCLWRRRFRFYTILCLTPGFMFDCGPNEWGIKPVEAWHVYLMIDRYRCLGCLSS